MVLDPQVAADTSDVADRTPAWIGSLAVILVLAMLRRAHRRRRSAS